jgi:hypothetical protein
MTTPIVGAPALAAAVGATARQVDYWTRLGWITPDNPNAGSGINTIYPPAAVDHARAMARLVAVGVNPGAAHELARRLEQVDRLDLGDGYALERNPPWINADGVTPPSCGQSPNAVSECPSTANPPPPETSPCGPTPTESTGPDT